MITKRPLLDTRADQAMYVADESRQRAVKAALAMRNTLIVGETGSGKTTLLYQIRGAARDRNEPTAVFVNARLAVDGRRLVDLMLVEAVGEELIAPVDPPADDDPFGAVSQIRRLGALSDSKVIFLIDDPTSEQAAVLFGRLRDELWQMPNISFVVAAHPVIDQEVLSQEPATSFFDTRITLEPLDPDAAFHLLLLRKDRGELPDGQEPLWPTRPLQPRAILLDAEAGPIGVRQDGELQARLMSSAEQAAGRSGAMLLSEIWGRGAVSASDEALQDSLGVSRVRLTQLLTELERAGVLKSRREKPPGSKHRPRTMYDINRAA